MRKKLSLLFFVFLFSYSSVALNVHSTDKKIYLKTLHYFYEEVIEHPKASCITINYMPTDEIPWGIGKTQQEQLLDNIIVNNYYNHPLRNDVDKFTSYLHSLFDGIADIHIISKEELEELHNKQTRRKDFFKLLFKRYPCSGGHLFLSPIAYNADETEAIICLENVWHYLNGATFLAICKKVDGEWQVQEIKAVSQS